MLLLVGAGRVGKNLLRHCAARDMAIAMVVEAHAARHASLRHIVPDAAVHSHLPARLPERVTHIVLAVPDAAIADVTRDLARILSPGQTPLVFHCSGTLGSALLAPLEDAGCLTGCIHPIQSFHSDNLDTAALVGIGCGIEGSDAFWAAGHRFAEELGWRPLRIDPARKVLYHAASVFAGNFTTVLAAVAEELLRHAACDPDHPNLSSLLPMMRTVLARLEHTPPAEALTGPAARGDHDTIARHRRELESVNANWAELYARLSALAVEVARR